jgi:hypothetical protein
LEKAMSCMGDQSYPEARGKSGVAGLIAISAPTTPHRMGAHKRPRLPGFGDAISASPPALAHRF